MSTDADTAALLKGFYAAMEGSRMVEGYHERHGTESALILTNYDDEHAALVTGYLEDRIAGKVVVEVGAGIGLLACHLAMVARRVYAIDVDPAWTSIFLGILYHRKPRNLTFIFGLADEAPPFAADVAIFCAHSGRESLYRAGLRFAPVVIDVYAELLSARAQRQEREAAVAP
jgi:hypothetical protein